MGQLVVAAAVQAGSMVFDTTRTLTKLFDMLSDAVGRRADLVVFPEAFVGGCPKGLDFGTRLGSRTSAGRDDCRRYFDSAIKVPGPETELIGNAVQMTHVHLVVGVIERDGGVGHYARPDVFTLLVNERPKKTVEQHPPIASHE